MIKSTCHLKRPRTMNRQPNCTPMKLMKLTSLLSILLGATTIPAIAQFYPPLVIDASMMKFFDANSAFSASVDFIQINPSNGKAGIRWPVRLAILDGKTRVEMDITKAAGKHVAGWEEYVAKMKTAGSSESVSIFNPDTKSVYIMLPRLKAYVENSIPTKAIEQMKKRPVTRKIEVGQEEIDGHPCIKYKLSFDEDRSDVWRTWEHSAAFVWSAKDLRGQPLRMVILGSDDRTNVVLNFKDISVKKPTSQLFKPPMNFDKCEDVNVLMKRIMENWPKKK